MSIKIGLEPWFSENGSILAVKLYCNLKRHKISKKEVCNFFIIFLFSGVEKLLKEPFKVNCNALNKHGMSALWLASKYNFINIGLILLKFGADPKVWVRYKLVYVRDY